MKKKKNPCKQNSRTWWLHWGILLYMQRKTHTYPLKPSRKTEKEETFPKSFYEATITLVPKPDKHTTQKKKKKRKKEKKRKLQASEVKVTQSCLPLCDPMDYTVHRILQARILEWVAFPFCRGSSQPRDQTQISHIAVVFFTSWATREEQLNSTIHKKNHTPWSSEIYSRVTRMAHHKHFKQCYTPH